MANDDDSAAAVEAIFIAANVAEVEFVEKLLESEGIEYEVTPEAFLRGALPGACLQGLLFQVLVGQAPSCRRLLAERGLARGVVDSSESGAQRPS